MSSLPNQILCLPVHITWEQMKKDARDFVPPSVIFSTKCLTIIQDCERLPPSCIIGPPLEPLEDLQVLKLTKLVACFSTLLGIETWGYIFNSNCQKKVRQEFQIEFLKTPVKAELKWKTPVNFNLFIDLFHHRMQRMYKGCANKYAWKGQSNGELNRITFKWSPHRQKSNQLGCMGHRKYIRENTVLHQAWKVFKNHSPWTTAFKG